MNQPAPSQLSYAMLFDPAIARAVAQRAAKWDLPRRICRPLDHYVGPRVSADVAAYDATVELAPALEEEILEDTTSTGGRIACPSEHDADDEDSDDL